MRSLTRRNRQLSTTLMLGIISLGFLASSAVLAPVPPPNWWNIGWRYRKSLIIDHTKIASDLTNFPVLINLTDSDLAEKAQFYGGDIVFTDINGQKLAHEIEFYDGTCGALIAWVKIPYLSPTRDTTIYIYYGNSDCPNQENPREVWDSNYMMVHHFNNKKYNSIECRFWGMISQTVLPRAVVLDHLINLPNSLKNLGLTNPDGWGLAYYNNNAPVILRGQPSAYTDPNFILAAQELASNGAWIGIGHVRKSTSPPYNVPNPHPFIRSKLGKMWTFAHHGVIDKSVLVTLIGEDYLAANPPQHGSSISDWNDSELYFIYLLKCIEKKLGDVKKGVAEAVTTICSYSSSYNMNFVLSDGTTLWAFRRGDPIHQVYYYYNSTYPQYSAVVSQYPGSTQGNWVPLKNYNFVELTGNNAPLIVEDVRQYATAEHFDSTANRNDGIARNGVVTKAKGKIDGGDYFDGVDDYIFVAHDSTLDGGGNWQQITVEFWAKSTRDHQKATIILSKRETGTTPFNSSYQIGFDSNGNSQLFWGLYLDTGYVDTPYSSCPTLVTDQWYHVVATFESPSIKLYVNGQLVSTSIKAGKILQSRNVPLRIGCRGTGTGLERFFAGFLDEVRISDIARSEGWIRTSFANQNNPSEFYTVGSEEAVAPTTMQVNPEVTAVPLGAEFTVYVEVTNVVDLYSWDFRLNYTTAVLELISCSIVPGGLNEPTYIQYNITDKEYGHIWWAVSTTMPTERGVSYNRHAIFEIRFKAKALGTSSLNLYGSTLYNSTGNPIEHAVKSGQVKVAGKVDLLVESVRVLDYSCSVYANDTYVDGATYYYPVEVRVRNIGTASAGSFYVKLEVFWINGLTTETSEEKFVLELAGETSVVVNFTDVFSPAHSGFYRLIVTVDSRNNVTESDETNNTLSLENIKVTVIGDINGDRVVNIFDGVIVSLAWSGTPGSPQWDIRADVNHDGQVNILDGARISLYWGRSW